MLSVANISFDASLDQLQFLYVVRFGQSEPFGHTKHLVSFAHMLQFS